MGKDQADRVMWMDSQANRLTDRQTVKQMDQREEGRSKYNKYSFVGGLL